jgi:hypothetical protein
MVPSSGRRWPGPRVVSWAGTRLAAIAEMPIPAATAPIRPLTPRQRQALRYGTRTRFSARRISVREMLGAG